MPMQRVRTGITGFGGGPFLATHFFNADTAPPAVNAVTAVRNFWAGVVGRMANTLVVQVEPVVATINEANGELTGTATSSTLPLPGTSLGDPLPSANQELVRWLTGAFIGGRQLRGRTFIPGLTELDNVNTRVSPGATGEADTAAEALIADANTTLVIWRRPIKDPVTGAIITPGSFAAVTSATVWEEFAVLRSRRD